MSICKICGVPTIHQQDTFCKQCFRAYLMGCDGMQNMREQLAAANLRAEQAEREVKRLRLALENCHMAARRGIASSSVAHGQLGHIVRFCEEAGVTVTLLRKRDDYGVAFPNDEEANRES